MPNTISSLLRDAISGIESVSETARLDAEVLLAQVTGKTRSHFLAWPERELRPEHIVEFRKLVEKRRTGMPIAYLTGTREFWSREFAVTPDVLIPRPETELLVEVALELLPEDQPLRILELGTGSGAIAVTLALERPMAQLTALDLSPAAIHVASENAKKLGATNIRFLVSDWFDGLGQNERFDMIVSNPPYIAESDAHLAEGDVRFEPRSALSAGPDGLDDIRSIAGAAPRFLIEGGWLLLEHGCDQGFGAKALLMDRSFTHLFTRLDLLGHPRISGGRRDTSVPNNQVQTSLKVQSPSALLESTTL